MPRSSEKTDGRRADFAKRLRALRVEKGLRQSELARRVALQMPAKRFGRSLISKYELGDTLPSAIAAAALATALGVTVDDLLPEFGIGEAMEPGMDVEIRSIDSETVQVRINERMPLEDGLRLMAIAQEMEKKRNAD